MSSASPQVLLRAAIVIGGVAFLLGLAGAVVLVLRERAPQTDVALRLRLQGALEDTAVAVEVTWEEEGSEVRQWARRGEEPRLWILPPVPADRTITILVLDRATEPPRVLARQDVEPSEHDELRMEVRQDGP